jgi:hypothetical protein
VQPQTAGSLAKIFLQRGTLLKPDDYERRLPRRSLLGYLTSSAGILGYSALAKGGVVAAPAAVGGSSTAPGGIAELARLQDTRTLRASSFDRSGGNSDSIPIEPAQTAVLMMENGPGVITHIWFTISSADRYHLKNLVLRMYWDGETEPSVEVPVGDFFGLGLGDYFLYQSALTTVASIKALNAYFPMPFSKSARITVTNEGMVRTGSFYFNIDYSLIPEIPTDLARFHAQYRQAAPCLRVAPGQGKNLLGADNYVFMEARGKGHLVGVTQAVLLNQEAWMGEGDEMIFIDQDEKPTITGTGTEDYYNGAWNFGGRTGAEPFAYAHNGAPCIVDAEQIGGRYCLYRWHIDNPIRFQKSLKFTIEHGDQNNRSDNFYTVAYWYQTEPHVKFPELPKAEDRIPRVYRVDAPGSVEMPKGE